MSLQLFTSSSLNQLVAPLCERLFDGLSPLQPAVAVVQTAAMSRWVSLRIAEKKGICTHVNFLQPAGLLSDLYNKNCSIHENTTQPVADSSTYTWAIYQQLLRPDLKTFPELGILSEYLDAPEYNFPLKGYRLAVRIADLFDQYNIYRPDVIEEWQKNNPVEFPDRLAAAEAWQRCLYRLVSPPRQRTRITQLTELTDALRRGECHNVPKAIHFFGISVLPSFYLRLAAALAPHTTVNFYLLSPYQAGLPEKNTVSPVQNEADPANLRTVLGRTGRDFFSGILEYFPDIRKAHYFFPGEPTGKVQVSNRGTTLLSAVHDDILSGGIPSSPQSKPIVPDDSIQAVSCHGPRREAEVLHDHILFWLDNDDSLTPEDILVMTPDLPAYAPFLEAVFSTEVISSAKKSIPFSITDRPVLSGCGIPDAFIQLLNLCGSRFIFSDVLAPLNCSAVQSKFKIEPDELLLVRDLLSESGIRWGLDVTHREEMEFPADAYATWENGINRLLAGYACASADGFSFTGTNTVSILPAEGISRQIAEILGRFLDYFRALRSLHIQSSVSGTSVEWAGFFSRMLEIFFAPLIEGLADLRRIQTLIRTFNEHVHAGGLTEKLSFTVVRLHMEERLGQDTIPGGFLCHGVTICTMQPLRAIPWRVICLLGLNDGIFPRQNTQLSYDLIARQPRPGDRDTRAGDEYLFLEIILCAREKLYLSYTGRSPGDNSPRLPALPLTLLLERLDALFPGGAVSETGDIKKLSVMIITGHPLQPFSRAYLTHADPRLFTYRGENFPLIPEIKPAGNELTTVSGIAALMLPEAQIPRSGIFLSPAEFIRFFTNPCKNFCQEILGLSLPVPEENTEPEECFAVKGLDSYSLRETLHWHLRRSAELLHSVETDFSVKNADVDNLVRVLQAQSTVPAANLGQICVQDPLQEAISITRGFLDITAGFSERRVTVKTHIGDCGVAVEGFIPGIFGNTLVSVYPSNLKARHLLESWLKLLIIREGASDEAVERAAIITNTHSTGVFLKTPKTSGYLNRFFDCWLLGRRRALPFFPETSLWPVCNYVPMNKKTKEKILRLGNLEYTPARWGDGYNTRGESSQSPWYAEVFPDLDFQSIAREPIEDSAFLQGSVGEISALFHRLSRELWQGLIMENA